MVKFKGRVAIILLTVTIGLLYVNYLDRKAFMSSSQSQERGKSWADGPIPLVRTPAAKSDKTDTWTTGASDMALLHNAIIRGYNTIYLQAPNIPPNEYVDFIGYSLTFIKFVKAHHDAEEASLFPQCLEILSKKGEEGDREIWGKSHDEHEAMMPPLLKMEEYLNGLKQPNDYAAGILMELLEGIKGPLELHLHSEIDVIASLSKFGSFPQSEAALEAWGRNSILGGGITEVVPFAFLNMDRTFEDGRWKDWPPIPAVVRFFFVRGSAWPKKGRWKFASCGVDGLPKALPYAK